jgi:hypothetical protein
MAALKFLSALEDLNLAHTVVDDSWVEVLRDLKTLRRLNLKGTNITAGGMARLIRQHDGRLIVAHDLGPKP